MRKALMIGWVLLLPAGLPADSILHEETSAPPEVADAIENLVLEWADRFNRGDWVSIHDSWDPDEEAPYYLGEERDRWVMGKEGLHSYFNPPAFVRSLMESVNIVPYRLRVRQVSDSIVIATWDNRLDIKVRTRPAINDDYRVNAVFRKKPEGWMFIHYAELAWSAITYMEHLYRKSVSPGFPEDAMPFDRNWRPAREDTTPN